MFNGKEYDKKEVRITDYGFVEEYTNGDIFCQSPLIGNGLSLNSRFWNALLYGAILAYMFLGIAIVSDIFMESIEEITS